MCQSPGILVKGLKTESGMVVFSLDNTEIQVHHGEASTSAGSEEGSMQEVEYQCGTSYICIHSMKQHRPENLRGPERLFV